MPLSQQAKKRVTILARVIDPDYQGETGLVLHNGYKEENVWNIRIPQGVLVLPCCMIEVSGKLEQSNSSRTANGPDRPYRNEGLDHTMRQGATIS